MKVFGIAILCSLLAQVSTADVLPRAEYVARCASIAKVYNRCEPHVIFQPEQNDIALPSLKTNVTCDDGQELTFLERLKHPDLASVLSQPYTRGVVALPVTEVNFSPGGLRNLEFQKAVYGATEIEVRRNLITINFLNQNITFNRVNGAAHQLELVSRDLLEIFKSGADPKLNAFLKPFLGLAPCAPKERCELFRNTFDWRVVKDTTALSNHSFGVAIDLQPVSGAQYWIWDLQRQINRGDAVFANGSDRSHFDPHDILNFKPVSNPDYPQTLVDIFEKHGFIWGGKWYRYDVMHFEFRPEFFPDEDLACE